MSSNSIRQSLVNDPVNNFKDLQKTNKTSVDDSILDEVRDLLRQASELQQVGRHNEASSSVRRASKLASTLLKTAHGRRQYVAVWTLAAELMRSQGRYRAAERTFTRAISMAESWFGP